jgi:hypothetical protein
VIFESGQDYYDLPIDSTIFSTPTSLNSGMFLDDRIKVYPNPVRGELTVTGLKGKTRFELFDLSGSLLLNKNSEKEKEILNLHGFLPGMYALRIIQGPGIVSKKIFVQ